MDIIALVMADPAFRRRRHRPATNTELYSTAGLVIGYVAGIVVLSKLCPDMETKKLKNVAMIPAGILMIIGGIIGFMSEH